MRQVVVTNKIVTDKLLLLELSKENRNFSLVMVNGTFDVFHAGHCSLLNKACYFGDKLIVLINSDDSIRQLKEFYQVETDEALIQAMLGNIEKLQAQVKSYVPDERVRTIVREG